MPCQPGSGSLDESCQPLGNRPPDINWLLHVYNENDMSIIYVFSKVMVSNLGRLLIVVTDDCNRVAFCVQFASDLI